MDREAWRAIKSVEVAKSLARLRLTLSLQDNVRVIFKLCWGQEKSGKIQPLGGSECSDVNREPGLKMVLLLPLLSRFSRVRLRATP